MYTYRDLEEGTTKINETSYQRSMLRFMLAKLRFPVFFMWASTYNYLRNMYIQENGLYVKMDEGLINFINGWLIVQAINLSLIPIICLIFLLGGLMFHSVLTSF